MNTDKSGQGVGLFMVKKLVDHFGGKIILTSQLGKGTAVFLKIPLLHVTSSGDPRSCVVPANAPILDKEGFYHVL